MMASPARNARDRRLRPGAYALVGETACGKSVVAHLLAARLGWTVCSADSMAVYRFMDIGTAKPTRAMRAEVSYIGIDLVDPDSAFGVGAYTAVVAPAIREAVGRGVGVIVVGGSGLYVKALWSGLRPESGLAPLRQACWERFVEVEGVGAALSRLADLSPEWRASVADPDNPRRVVRALVMAEQGVPPGREWARTPMPVVAGLRHEAAERERRIALRARNMYDSGLVEETRRLRGLFPVLSRTARHAIGYAEAADCLSGTCSEEDAVKLTILRSRQLARRQRSWFRTQADVAWIECGAGVSVDELSDRVLNEFERNGPMPIA
jgi:tRNA dimethylallyltransferase